MTNKLRSLIRARKPTRRRILFALAVAAGADALQLTALGFPPFVQIIDVIAMLLTIWMLGFHLLLLPTFVMEFIPWVDMLPTWTACTMAVIALRIREQVRSGPLTPPSEPKKIESPPPL